jgi:hypothetical protein
VRAECVELIGLPGRHQLATVQASQYIGMLSGRWQHHRASRRSPESCETRS